MNRRKILNVLGRVLSALALLLLLPTAVSIYFGESCAVSFLITDFSITS